MTSLIFNVSITPKIKPIKSAKMIKAFLIKSKSVLLFVLNIGMATRKIKIVQTK